MRKWRNKVDFPKFFNKKIERVLKNSLAAKTKKAASFGMVRTSRFLRNVFKKKL